MPPKSTPSPEEFLLAVLANSESIKTNWQAVASQFGYSRANDTQQKFKKLVESTKKYQLVNGKVIDLEAIDGNTVPATPAKRGGRGAKATPQPSGGRKRKAKDNDENDSEDAADQTPVKKRAPAAKRATIKAVNAEESVSDTGMKQDVENGEEKAAAVAARKEEDV